MPIYAYKCGSCGHAKDVLQKLSDAPLSVCPACSAPAFSKQVTAAGFQLKGSGWYVTDFRGGSQDKPASGAVGGVESKAATTDGSTSSSNAEAASSTGNKTATESSGSTQAPSSSSGATASSSSSSSTSGVSSTPST